MSRRPNDLLAGLGRAVQRRPRVTRSKRMQPVVANPGRTTAALAVVALVLVVVAAVLTVANSSRQDRENTRADALKGATTAVETLLSYDFRSIETAVADHQDLVTGEFGKDYPSYVTDTLAPPVLQNRLQNVTAVAEGAVVSADGDEVVVLLFVNQTFGSVGQADQKSAGSRVRVTVRKIDGTWRVADLTPV